MPEAFNFVNRTTEWNGYPLRPEFVESTYYLYRATKDPFYLDVGARILRDLKKRTQTQCGFAVIHDVLTGKVSLEEDWSTSAANLLIRLLARRSHGKLCAE